MPFLVKKLLSLHHYQLDTPVFNEIYGFYLD